MRNAKAWVDKRLHWLEVQCKANWGRDWQEHYGVAYEAAIRLAKAFDLRKCRCQPELYVARLLPFRVSDIIGRRRKEHKTKPPILTASLESWASNVPTSAAIAASADSFERLLHGLDPSQKAMTRMYCGGLSMKEVGRAMGVSGSAISQRFTIVKALIRKDLADADCQDTAPLGR